MHVVGWMELKPLLETLSEVALQRDERSEKVIEKVHYVCGLRCPEWKLLNEDDRSKLYEIRSRETYICFLV